VQKLKKLQHNNVIRWTQCKIRMLW